MLIPPFNVFIVVLTGSIELHHFCDHLCNQIFVLSSAKSQAPVIILQFWLNSIFKCLFLFSTKFLSLSPRLKFYLDIFRPDFSDFRSEPLINILSALYPNRPFLNTCSPFRIKLS